MDFDHLRLATSDPAAETAYTRIINLINFGKLTKATLGDVTASLRYCAAQGPEKQLRGLAAATWAKANCWEPQRYALGRSAALEHIVGPR